MNTVITGFHKTRGISRLAEEVLLVSYQNTSPSPRPVKRFVTSFRFCGEELLAPRPISKLKYHPLSALHDCLFNISAATLHIWRPFLHPQPEDALCSVLLTNYYSGHQIKKNEMGGACGTYAEQESCIKGFGGET
jgi:hypothetical protein